MDAIPNAVSSSALLPFFVSSSDHIVPFFIHPYSPHGDPLTLFHVTLSFFIHSGLWRRFLFFTALLLPRLTQAFAKISNFRPAFVRRGLMAGKLITYTFPSSQAFLFSRIVSYSLPYFHFPDIECSPRDDVMEISRIRWS